MTYYLLKVLATARFSPGKYWLSDQKCCLITHEKTASRILGNMRVESSAQCYNGVTLLTSQGMRY